MEAPFQLGLQRVVTGLPNVLQVAILVDVADLRERAQCLFYRLADSIGTAGCTGETRIGLNRRRAEAVGTGCDRPPVQTGAHTQIFLWHVVWIVEQSMQAGGMVADVSQREVEIGSELDLVFQVP